MPSSESTRSPRREPAVPLFLWLVGDDAPRACTGRRLLRAGAVHRLAAGRAAPSGLLLDPYVDRPLAPDDRNRARRGLMVVDCSWNRLSARRTYPSSPLDSVPRERRRRLPWLLAGNPQHFGRVGELNTSEALAAALVVLGQPAEARAILGHVGAGETLLTLNAERFARYLEASDATGIREAEAELA